ncbi:uncharacterized protein LOC111862919 isoform X3 [Cryptotermes secundus]|uniref:uncharacterized protein LOC111862919 isoform X3 n=1 Tax=Cryptotermes secundus TaxID=105785 RepID=UPI000CD7D4D6|nr:uncharacterized protein LOC111862919 isoform X3 [Cryptotermes secundus]
MESMKPEPDEESSYHSENELIVVKQDEVLATRHSTVKTEHEQNTDTVKVEHNVDILNEDDSTCMNSGDIYIPSACSIAKAEPEDSMELLEVALGSCTEINDTSHDGNKIISIKVEDVPDIQHEEDPLLITFPAVKEEHELSQDTV